MGPGREERAEAEKGKILVLVVDIDDDLGEAGISTPIVGYAEVLKAAEEFGIKRPEDSDLNAIFAGLKLFNELRSRGKNVEIAVVAGDPRSDVEAELRIREQLEEIVASSKSGGAILVADGAHDERIVPVIQSVIPIFGVKRVIVEQLTGVEETYILIGRYLRKAVMEPRFSRWFLGVPGLVMTIIGLLAMLNLLQHAAVVAITLMGVAMLVRGFNLEDKILEYWASSPIMFIASTLSTIIVAIGAAIAYYTLSHAEVVSWSEIGSLLEDLTPLAGMAAFSVLIGRLIDKILRKNLRVRSELVGIVTTVITVLAFGRLATALQKLSQTPRPGEVASALTASGFIEVFFGGIAIIGLTVLLLRFVERRMGAVPEGQ